MVRSPRFLICDDIARDLESDDIDPLLSLLKDLNTQDGLGIVLISHHLDALRDIADDIAILDAGRIVEQGRLFDVVTSPSHPTTRRLVQDTTHRDLPESLWMKIRATPIARGNPVIRITFTGSSANHPVITEIRARFGVSLNILHGHVDYIQDSPYGLLTVEAMGNGRDVQEALNYLRAQNLKAEVIGHVAGFARAVA